MMNHRTSLASVLLVLALAGCATSAPEASAPTPTSTPTPAVEPVPAEPAALVIAGSDVRVLDAQGSQLDSLPYSSEPAVASAFFSELFGAEPVVSSIQSDGNCVPDGTVEVWDDGFRMAHGELILPEGQRFVVSGTAPEAHDIAMTTPNGATIGDPVDRLEADIPVEQRHEPRPHDGATFVQVDYDVVEGEWLPETSPDYSHTVYWGAKATGRDGVLDGLMAPTAFYDHC
jgi:hypothetical protein